MPRVNGPTDVLIETSDEVPRGWFAVRPATDRGIAWIMLWRTGSPWLNGGGPGLFEDSGSPGLLRMSGQNLNALLAQARHDGVGVKLPPGVRPMKRERDGSVWRGPLRVLPGGKRRPGGVRLPHSAGPSTACQAGPSEPVPVPNRMRVTLQREGTRLRVIIRQGGE